jgi:hypothetical protein
MDDAAGCSRFNDAPTLKSPAQGEFVGIFEIAADGQTARDAGHLQTEWLQESRQIHRRRVAFEVRIRTQDHFGDRLGLYSTEQLADTKLFGPDALDRIQCTTEHVIAPSELSRPFDSDDVARILNDTDKRLISSLVCTDRADRARADVEAQLADHCFLGDFDDGAGETKRVFFCHLQQVKSYSLRGLRSDTRQASEFVDEILYGAFKKRQERFAS